jgi:hypothetical protein
MIGKSANLIYRSLLVSRFPRPRVFIRRLRVKLILAHGSSAMNSNVRANYYPLCTASG